MKLIFKLLVLILFLTNCKKTENLSSPEELSGIERQAISASCNIGLKTHLQGRVSQNDFNRLEFDSATVFQVNQEEYDIYLIPFNDLDPFSDFTLVAVDSLQRIYKGAIVSINGDDEEINETGGFQGEVTVSSLSRSITETIQFQNGKRTNYLNGSLLTYCPTEGNEVVEEIVLKASVKMGPAPGISLGIGTWIHLLTILNIPNVPNNHPYGETGGA